MGSSQLGRSTVCPLHTGLDVRRDSRGFGPPLVQVGRVGLSIGGGCRQVSILIKSS